MGKLMLNDIGYSGGSGGGGNANEEIISYADYMALTEEEKNNGTSYYIYDAQSDGKEIQPVIYSLEEREIGVWTDGKPLYQKSIIIDSGISSGNQWEYSHGIPNIDTVVFCEGFMIDNGDSSFLSLNVQSISGSSNLSGDWLAYITKVGPTKIYAIIGNSIAANISAIRVTIQYTKTTDVAGSGNFVPSGIPTVHYDGNEKVIGTWFGETLYEKTIDFGYLPNATSASVQGNISNVDRIISISGAGQTATYSIPIPLPHATSLITCFYNISTDEVTITTTSDRSSAYAFITIRYTKSTS